MLTSDFIWPAATIHVVAGIRYLRGSVRVRNFASRQILRTITLPNSDQKWVTRND